MTNIIIPIAGLMLSTALEFASLWQIEILEWDLDDSWDAPFFSFKLTKYMARDLWYAVQIFAWILGIISAFTLAKAIN